MTNNSHCQHGLTITLCRVACRVTCPTRTTRTRRGLVVWISVGSRTLPSLGDDVSPASMRHCHTRAAEQTKEKDNKLTMTKKNDEGRIGRQLQYTCTMRSWRPPFFFKFCLCFGESPLFTAVCGYVSVGPGHVRKHFVLKG